jgi:DNA-binding beta-propeller fold protein YncE
VLVALLSPNGLRGVEPALKDTPKVRRPVALVAVDAGKTLLAANRCGTVSVIDTQESQVVAEWEVGRSLADLVALPGGSMLLAVDEAAGELLVLERNERQLRVAGRTKVSPAPVSIAVSADGRRALVASLWSRRLTIVALDGGAPEVRHVIDLPFAPRRQQPLADGVHLAVADAFGGRLAVVDTQSAAIVALHELPGHNLRGLALSPGGESLLVSHQALDPHSDTSGESVHWGGVLKNLVHKIAVEELLKPDGDVDPAGSRFHLGYPDRAAGDPDAMLTTADGRWLIALAGVDELAVSDVGANYFRRVPVGRRPTAIALGAGGVAWTANTLSDSLTAVEIATGKVLAEVSLGPSPEETPALRGERLFYDARLSRDGWFSCHACHVDGHTNGLASDNFGDETYGAPKLTPSLLGTGATAPWAWNASSNQLGEQIHKSITVTMQGEPPTKELVRDLEAYLQTLQPPPSLLAARGQLDLPLAERGRAVFEAQGCADCHQGTRYTSRETYDVGLADELGAKRFNPPSLLGFSQRSRYLHDGRTGDLWKAIEAHNPHVRTLNDDERAALMHFLRGL